MNSLISTCKTLAYETVDVLTGRRGVERNINGESIRFPTRWARYYEANYEPNTFEFFRASCRPGDTVLDVGAHMGLFSVVIAKLVGANGRVFAFEPTPQTRQVLQKTVALNHCQQIVEVRGEAVAEESGTATFFETGEAASNANSLTRTERHVEGLLVPTVSVDDFVRQRNLQIKCLKIDVEGTEFGVLRGAEETIKTQRPMIHLGLHPDALKQANASLAQIWQLLQDLNLDVSYEKRLVTREWFTEQTSIIDVQCTPVEKAV